MANSLLYSISSLYKDNNVHQFRSLTRYCALRFSAQRQAWQPDIGVLQGISRQAALRGQYA